MSEQKELKKLRRIATKEGWQVRQGPGGHLKWVPPEHLRAKRRRRIDAEGIAPSQVRLGDTVTSSLSPSDHRAIKNLRARLRKAGLKNA